MLEPKRAVFFMATHHRPHLLAAALRHLIFQKVPPGWTYDIWVVGEPHDPGKDVVAYLPQVTYHSIDSSVVTDKLNFLLKKTKAELVLLADDDDLQPLNRLEVAIKAHEEGAEWAGPGTLFMYATREKFLMKWIGRAEEGLVGTGMSYRTSLLRMINGWPRKSRGKDHPIAARITGCLIRVKFKSLDGVLGPLVGLQHGKNMWGRPVLKQGEKSKKGRFQILGMGTLDQVPIISGFTRQTIALLGGENPIEKLRLAPPTELPVTQAPVKSRARGKSVKGNRIHISITTFDRPDSLLDLLQDIVREGHEFQVKVRVYNDRSKADYSAVIAFIHRQGWEMVWPPKKHGKRWYTKLMSLVFQEASRIQANYFYFIQDDIRLCRDFFSRTIELWDGIRDPRKATLYLLRDSDRARPNSTCWTKVVAQRVGHVDRTQWVDGNAFMFGHNVWGGFPSGIPGPPSWWVRDPKKSSGFGRQVSRELHAKGYGLYRTQNSMVAHLHQNSVMNPNVRKEQPLLAVDFIDGEAAHLDLLAGSLGSLGKVTVSLASIPSRTHLLEKVVQCLLPQVDQLNVYLNNYGRVPGFITHPKITVAQSERHGDRGDSGKFFWSSNCEGYFFTCDDDILYPPDYVKKMVASIEKYQRKVVVGVHGAILKQPIQSYYNSRRVLHYMRGLPEPIQVHVLGTATVAFHTSTIRINPGDFKKPNMADIWFALEGQRQKIPFLCIERKSGWLQGFNYEGESIFGDAKKNRGSSLNTSEIQTEVTRGHHWVLPSLED